MAGEVGMACGAVYTSYSGFFVEPGSGKVQICAMARALSTSGFAFMDLGQFLDTTNETSVIHGASQ